MRYWLGVILQFDQKEHNTEITSEEKHKLDHARYRFLRRYLMKFYPDIADKTNLECLTVQEIEYAENKIVSWKFDKEDWCKRVNQYTNVLGKTTSGFTREK